MAMRALLITTEYPFPPRNGITIPVANYARLLQERGWTIDLIVVGADLPNRIAADAPIIRRATSLSVGRSRIAALTREALLEAPWCCSFQVMPRDWTTRCLQDAYELILASPLNVITVAVEAREYLAQRFGLRSPMVAAINDSYTAELAMASADWFRSARAAANVIRSKYMGRIERHLLAGADHVFVQSEADKNWLQHIGGRELGTKTHVVTNGVDEQLFSMPLRTNRRAKRFCFAADFRSQAYHLKVSWLYREVWCKIDIASKELHLFGPGLTGGDATVRELLADSTVVYHSDFVERLPDLYDSMDVAYAPIFKRCGFINKVGEALAAGVAVIGDETAFAAIRGFQPGVHGWMANTAAQMAAASVQLHENVALLDELKIRGRHLAEEQLRWRDRAIAIESVFNT